MLLHAHFASKKTERKAESIIEVKCVFPGILSCERVGKNVIIIVEYTELQSVKI
jgi:hypothetical protein